MNLTLDPSVSLIDKAGRASEAFFTWIVGVQTLLSGRSFTVAKLPSANKGDRCFVTDSNATTFRAVVAGGGANFVPVFYDGTNWRIG